MKPMEDEWRVSVIRWMFYWQEGGRIAINSACVFGGVNKKERRRMSNAAIMPIGSKRSGLS